MTTAVTTLALLIGVPPAGAVVYRLTLAVASLFHRTDPIGPHPLARLSVVVPAHDEAAVIARCVRSLLEQRYPSDRFRVVVVADNCTDETASTARSAGADVLIRRQPMAPGKGRALRWAIDQLLGRPEPPDAVVVVDADSVAERDLLRELEARFAAGHDVVQAEYLLRPEADSPRAQLEAAALLLHHRVRFRGRTVLGMPAFLCGNGMLFSSAILRRHPWNAFMSVEDAEYSTTLRLHGVRVAYAAGARLYAEPTPDERAAFTQALRWEGGRFFMMRRWLGRVAWAMVHERRWDLYDTLLELATPPLGVLTMLTIAGTLLVGVTVISGIAAGWALLPWAIALLGLPAYVLIGLRAASAPGGIYRALLSVPWFLVRKLAVLRRLTRGIDLTQWARTERLATPAGRVREP